VNWRDGGIMKRLDQAFSLVKQHGIFKFTWLAFRFILRKAIGIDWWTDIILERSMAEPIKEVVPRIPVVFRQVKENELGIFKGIVTEQEYQRFQQKFRRGRLCFIALDGDKIAAYCWISLDEYDLTNENDTSMQKEMNMKQKEAYFFDILVFPQYRNNKIQTALDVVRLKYVLGLAYNKVFTTITAKNAFSLKSAASSGFRLYKALKYYRIFGRQFYHVQEYRY
jgi:hypothetical protein